MPNSALLFLCKSLLVSAAFVSVVAAQDETPTLITSQNRSGDLPFTTTIGSGVESVDVVSGNIKIRIPIASVKGRGLNYDFVVRYDSGFWAAGTRYQAGTGNYQVWNIEKRNYLPDATTGSGWEPNQPFVTWVKRVQNPCNTPGFNSQATVYTSYIYHDALGAKHPLTGQLGTDCYGNTVVSSGPDLTFEGMWASLTSVYPTLRLSNGTQLTRLGSIPCDIYNGCGAVYPGYVSPNGNQETEAAAGLDTLGRAIVTQQSGTNQLLYKVYDSGGTQRTYTLNYANTALATAFNVTGTYSTLVREYSGSRNLITSIVLPNGRSYSFQYENGSYGGITRIDLPTGGYVTYTWGTFSDHERTHRYITSRTLNVNGQSYTWNISRQCTVLNGFCTTITSTVTDPLGNVSVYSAVAGEVTSAKIYNGAAVGNPVRQYTIGYQQYDDPTGSESSGLPNRLTTTLDDGRVSKKEFDYEPLTFAYTDSSDFWNFFTSNYNTSRGNVTEIREYDFGAVPGSYGSGTPGPLIRRTDKTYLHNSNSNYGTYNIVDKEVQETIYNASSTQIGQTQFEYDNYVAGDNPLLSTTAAAQHDYTNFSSSFLYRGNATRVKRWRNTDGALLTSTYSYDDLGNIRAIKDPLSHSTTYDYTDSFANSFCPPPAGKNGQGYVSTVTNALGQQVKVVRYPCTSLVQAHKDQNDINAGRAGTTYTYDLMNRLLTKNLSDTGQTSMTYNDVPPVSSTSTTKITSSLNLVSTTVLDGLGRQIQSQLTSDPQGTVYTDTTYDALGRTSIVSNPYRSTSDPTYGLTTTQYDALSRVTKVIPPDGTTSANNVTTSYSGNCATVTDQAGKNRKSCSDPLGRLKNVWENPTNLNYETDYQYDALNNLTSVVQVGSRQRTFVYDSLSRLTSATNPESGTTTYTYDNDGNVLTKKDARNITITYYPDALNRLGAKAYSDGTETLYYSYDVPPGYMPDCTNVVGRLANTSNSSGGSTDGKATAATFSYDAMGRVVRYWQQTPSASPGGYFISQSYDLAGDLSSATNAAGVTISYTYDAATRPTIVTSNWGDAQHPATLYTVDPSIGYFPSGALRKATLTNGLTETAMYNTRLQPCRMEINSTAAYLAQCTSTVPSGNVLDFTYGYNSGSSNNGNVANWSSVGNQTFTRSYGYDSLNRIWTLSDTATAQTCKGLSWTIDAWGNRTDQIVTSGTCGTFHAIVGTNNRFGSPYQYDAAGNMTYDGTHTYTYDAENRITQVDGGATASYIYDPSGTRVRKNSGGSWTEYFYDMSGNVTAERNPAGWPVEYVYVGGQLIAQYRDNTTYSIFKDHLGSTRLITKLDKSVYDSLDFLPYGEQLAGDTGTTHKFTGKERDPESGLDFFGARYFGSSLGRFTTPDAPFADQHSGNPQTWNLYAYGRNNPLGGIDTNGREYLCVTCVVQAVKNWWNGGVARDGGTGNFAKNNAIGAGKGTGTFALNTIKTVVAASEGAHGNIPGALATITAPSPTALQPSNQTQAQASTATQVTLAVASVVVPGAIEGAAAPATTSLFRAVGTAEAESIEATGAFSGAPNGTMFKGFFFEQADAESFGARMTELTGEPHTVVPGEAPTELVNSSPPHNAATEGPGVLIRNKDLPQVKPNE